MMKRTLTAILILTLFNSCTAQKKDNVRSAIAFYNTENLFDTTDDPKTWDDDFTPDGKYRYTQKVYKEKLHNIATVIDKLDASLIGLAEIENQTVLKDLVAQPELKSDRYKFITYNSNDARGIDVALLYRESDFKVLSSEALPVMLNGLEFTRDVLYVYGIWNKDTIHLMVNHWPSRREGKEASAHKRAAAAQVNKEIVDSLMRKNINSKIVIMGDMNDNPDDESITTVLRCYDNRNIEKLGFLYNPWNDLYKKGKGTSVYHRHWDLFDQIVISDGWLSGKGMNYKSVRVYDEAFIRNDYKGDDAYPKRSFRGNRWGNGYSDHLPVIMYFSKN